MALVNLQTDLTSIPFGRDRRDGGDSGQPYIPVRNNDLTTSIGLEGITSEPSLATQDFILRGGIQAPDDAFNDVRRLTKFFEDKNSPNGVLFIAKQNALSLTAVRTQAATVGSPNGGVYTPLNTLAQAGAGFLGTYFPKQGLTPAGVRLYGPKSSFNPLSITAVNKVIGGDDGNENRLVQLTELKINKYTNFKSSFRKNQIAKGEDSILSYIGGPKAPLGIGRTRIQFATDNKGNPTGTGLNSPIFSTLKGGAFESSLSEKQGLPAFNASLTTLRSYVDPASFLYTELNPLPGEILESFSNQILQKDIKSSTIMSISPSYTDAKNRLEGEATSRINYRSPGQRGNVINYTLGKRDGQGRNIGAVDKINALPIYRSNEGPKQQENINDLVQFRIAAINQTDPKFKDYIHFRAYIDDFSDKYSGKWKPINYMGRAESFYKYDSFDRDINLSFTVAAQSKEELMVQYRKLNYLASNLAPTYSPSGYMGGSLVELTVGGWCYELPGFIEGFSLGPAKESPWEIGIDTEGKVDQTVRELPHIVEVKGFKFTPIHKFRPERQELEPSSTDTSEQKEITEYGPQHYISLANRSDSTGTSAYNTTLMKAQVTDDLNTDTTPSIDDLFLQSSFLSEGSENLENPGI